MIALLPALLMCMHSSHQEVSLLHVTATLLLDIMFTASGAWWLDGVEHNNCDMWNGFWKMLYVLRWFMPMTSGHMLSCVNHETGGMHKKSSTMYGCPQE